jgi:hypothetical protein
MDNKMITNGTEHDYKLTIHAAGMLVKGIQEYIEFIQELYDTEVEPSDYCYLMLGTAKIEAKRLSNWMKSLNTDLVSSYISHLDDILKECENLEFK